MNSRKINLVQLLALAVPCLVAQADMVTDWNSVALNAIKVDQTPPPKASRGLAILHVSIYDACNGIGQNYRPYYVIGKAAGVASKEAAIAAAARKVLVHLYPAQQSAFEAAYASSVASIAGGPGKSVGISWGESVANAILQLRDNDGSSNMVAY